MNSTGEYWTKSQIKNSQNLSSLQYQTTIDPVVSTVNNQDYSIQNTDNCYLENSSKASSKASSKNPSENSLGSTSSNISFKYSVSPSSSTSEVSFSTNNLSPVSSARSLSERSLLSSTNSPRFLNLNTANSLSSSSACSSPVPSSSSPSSFSPSTYSLLLDPQLPLSNNSMYPFNNSSPDRLLSSLSPPSSSSSLSTSNSTNNNYSSNEQTHNYIPYNRQNTNMNPFNLTNNPSQNSLQNPFTKGDLNNNIYMNQTSNNASHDVNTNLNQVNSFPNNNFHNNTNPTSNQTNWNFPLFETATAQQQSNSPRQSMQISTKNQQNTLPHNQHNQKLLQVSNNTVFPSSASSSLSSNSSNNSPSNRRKCSSNYTPNLYLPTSSNNFDGTLPFFNSDLDSLPTAQSASRISPLYNTNNSGSNQRSPVALNSPPSSDPIPQQIQVKNHQQLQTNVSPRSFSKTNSVDNYPALYSPFLSTPESTGGNVMTSTSPSTFPLFPSSFSSTSSLSPGTNFSSSSRQMYSYPQTKTYSPIRPNNLSIPSQADFIRITGNQLGEQPPPSTAEFSKVRSRADLKPVNNPSHLYRRAAPDGSFISPLLSLTVNLPFTYSLCNPAFVYDSHRNPRRVLTKPSKGVKNSGFDNEDNDYILYVNDILGGSSVNGKDILGEIGDHHTQNRYLILDLLGQGTFGQVVKCQNIKTKEIVAVKVIKNKQAYFNQSMMEVSILELLNGNVDIHDEHHILRLKDKFIHKNHLCIVSELLSSNLYELIKQNQFRGLSLSHVRTIAIQLLDALCLLKDARLIHCDLKPENILLRSTDSPLQIKVIDFGSACHERQTVYTYIQSRFYRSPEVMLGMPYSASIDMWSFGCILAELFLGLPLFPGSSEYNQICRIVEMLGLPPHFMLEMGKQSTQFFDKGFDQATRKSCYKLKSLEKYSREQSKEEKPSTRYFTDKFLADIINSYSFSKRNLSKAEIENEIKERAMFVDFLMGVLNLNPFERWTPQQALSHPFIQKDYSLKKKHLAHNNYRSNSSMNENSNQAVLPSISISDNDDTLYVAEMSQQQKSKDKDSSNFYFDNNKAGMKAASNLDVYDPQQSNLSNNYNQYAQQPQTNLQMQQQQSQQPFVASPITPKQYKNSNTNINMSLNPNTGLGLELNMIPKVNKNMPQGNTSFNSPYYYEKNRRPSLSTVSEEQALNSRYTQSHIQSSGNYEMGVTSSTFNNINSNKPTNNIIPQSQQKHLQQQQQLKLQLQQQQQQQLQLQQQQIQIQQQQQQQQQQRLQLQQQQQQQQLQQQQQQQQLQQQQQQQQLQQQQQQQRQQQQQQQQDMINKTIYGHGYGTRQRATTLGQVSVPQELQRIGAMINADDGVLMHSHDSPVYIPPPELVQGQNMNNVYEDSSQTNY